MSFLWFSQNTLKVNESIYKESPRRILDITDMPLVYTLAPGKKLTFAVWSLGGATVVMAGIPANRRRSFLGKGRRRCCASPGIGSWPGLWRKWRVWAQPAEQGGGGCWGSYLWRPRFLINPNRRSTRLTVVKSRSTWVLTSKNLPTNSNDRFGLVDTHVGPTHGQRLGQTPLKP
jgi:hypothetical protein